MEVVILPFLKPKASVGIIVSKRKPDGGQETTPEDQPDDSAMLACAEDLIRAIHSKDAKAVAGAIRAALECADEGDSDNESNDYDSMNAKAAQEQE